MALELTEKVVPGLARSKSGGVGVCIAAKERLFFTEQLTLLLETGTNLHNSLRTLTRQSRSKQLKLLIDDIADHISGGQSFSQALTRHPRSFTTTYINLVKAGEEGGFLPKVLEQLLKMEERSAKLRGDIISAVSYPVFLLLFSMAVVVFVLVVVFPKFDAMFTSIADQLPPTTKALMVISELLRNNVIVICVFFAAAAFLFFQFWRSENGRRLLDRAALYLPLVRSICVPLYLVQSLRVMSLSLGNGVAIVDTLTACRDVVPNSHFRSFIGDVELTIRDGAGIAAGFRKADFMPDIVKEMIATGEESGALPKVMSRVATYYENDLEKRLGMIARMAEPVMLIVMGLVVGILVSSLILPIFQLSRAAH